MKKYLLGGLFVFMFAFMYQTSILQSQNRPSSLNQAYPFQPLQPLLGVRDRSIGIDGECYRTPLDESPFSFNDTTKEETDTLCESGSFVLIENNDDRIIYACSGSFGGKSIICNKDL